MIRSLCLVLSAVILLLTAPPANSQSADVLFRVGNYEGIVADWKVSPDTDPAAAGHAYFSAYYTSNETVLEDVSVVFAGLRASANPDKLGVGLGDLMTIHQEMQQAPFLQGNERKLFFEMIDNKLERLSVHPEPEVAAYAAYYLAFVALMAGDIADAQIRAKSARISHSAILELNRDWQLMALQIELVVASEAGDTKTVNRIFEGFSFDQLTGSPFEGGFVDSLAGVLLDSDNGVLAEEFAKELVELIASLSDPSTRFWRTFYLANGIADGANDLTELASEVFFISGAHATTAPSIDGETLYFAVSYEMARHPAAFKKALLSAALGERSIIPKTDEYLGQLLTLWSEIESELGEDASAIDLARRAAGQPVAEAAAALLAEVEQLAPREAFLRLDQEKLSISLDDDLAGKLAVSQRLYQLAFVVDGVDQRDMALAVSWYARLLAQIGRAAESDRAFSAYVAKMQEFEASDASAAVQTYRLYQSHLQRIGKFSKAVSVERDINRAQARASLQELAAKVRADVTFPLFSFVMKDAVDLGLFDEVRGIAELAESKLDQNDVDVIVKFAALAMEAYIYLETPEHVIVVADRALSILLVRTGEIPSIFDLSFAAIDTMPELSDAIVAAERLANDLADPDSNPDTIRRVSCLNVFILQKTAELLGCTEDTLLVGSLDTYSSSGDAADIVENPVSPLESDILSDGDLYELQEFVVNAPSDQKLEALLELRKALLRNRPDNLVALADVDVGIALEYATLGNDESASFFAESAFESYVASRLVSSLNLFLAMDLLPGTGLEKLARIESTRPIFEAYAGGEPVEAWLDLNLGCIAATDDGIAVRVAANYILEAYESAEIWKRFAPGCDPVGFLQGFVLRLEQAPIDELNDSEVELTKISTHLIDITRAGSDTNILAHKMGILAARANGDSVRAEAGLAVLLQEPYRSNSQQTHFIQEVEERNALIAVGEDALEELFSTPTIIPALNNLQTDIALTIRSLIKFVPPEDLRPWIEKHAGMKFDETTTLSVDETSWEIRPADPEVLSAWALDVAEECQGPLSNRYLYDQSGCVSLALDLADQSFKDLAVGRKAVKEEPFLPPYIVANHQENLEPGRLASRLRELLNEKVDPSRLENLDRLALEVIAAAEPSWVSQLDFRESDSDRVMDWLGPDEAVVLLTLDRLTVVRNDKVMHVSREIPLRSLTADIRALRSAAGPKIDGSLSSVSLDAAWSLWQTLFEPIETELVGVSHIWIQAPPVLQQVPFEALVTRPPEKGEWQAGDPAPGWLIERFSISIVPSITGLEALRYTPPSQAEEALLGLGAPSLLGTGGSLRTVEALMTDGIVDPVKVAALPKLTDAEDEISMLVEAVGTENSASYLGDAFTRGALNEVVWSDFRTIVFATHGLVAGQAQTPVRALLILSPTVHGGPAHIEADDIETYQLDANLVILAACDTGVIDDPAQEFGASVFAESFVESGARTVLVSKWPLDSRDAWRFSLPLIGKNSPGQVARTLRDVRMKAIQSDDKTLSHPSFWAAITVVGDVPYGG